MHLLVDMDGVLVDLLKGWSQFKGFTIPDPYPYGTQLFTQLFGISCANVWLGCDEKFWAELPPTKEAQTLMTALEELVPVEDISLISTIVTNPSAAAGKIHWIAKHFPRYANSYIFTHQKHRLSHEGVVLIDDEVNNVTKFQDGYGHAFLYPALWNDHHNNALKSVEVTRRHVQHIVRAEQDENW